MHVVWYKKLHAALTSKTTLPTNLCIMLSSRFDSTRQPLALTTIISA